MYDKVTYYLIPLEEDIIKFAIDKKNDDILERYDNMFFEEMLKLKALGPQSGFSYFLYNNCVATRYAIVGRMKSWEKEAIDAAISNGNTELAKKMIEHNKLYINEYFALWQKKPKEIYVITEDEVDRQFNLANVNLNDSERIMLLCIKNSCIVKDEFIKIRDLKLARKIIENYAYCEYDYIYTCIKNGKNKELYKFFLDRDDEENARRLMIGKLEYNHILSAIEKYVPSEVKVAIYEKFKKNNSFGKVDYDYFVHSLIANKDLLNDNPVIELIKQLKDDLYKKVQELVEADKKAEEEKIERAKIVKGLTKDYFDNLLRNNGEELFYIKLCSLLDAIFKFDFHYTGEDFSERMNAHFKALEDGAPKPRDCDDGWGYMVNDYEYEKQVVIPEKNRIEHLKDIFNRLRIERNNIAHSEHQDVKKLTEDELNECLEYVFSINKEVE